MENSGISASALVVIDKTAFGYSTWDIPRGPITIENSKSKIKNLLDILLNDAEETKCFAIYYSPTKNQIEHGNYCATALLRYNYPSTTRIIDLRVTEAEILAQMKSKGRYNIHIAEKHGVKVIKSDDIDAFYKLVRETAERDKFKCLPKKNYEMFLKNLEGSFLLLALDQNKKPIGGLLGVTWNKTGIYYYGASSYNSRALMAPYLLQWEAMKRCKNHGCISYDLFGISPNGSPDNHPWKGVTEFKEKFGGEVLEYPEEKTVVLKPMIKKIIDLKRRWF